MTSADAIHAAILAGFKRANIGAAHVRLARIVEQSVISHGGPAACHHEAYQWRCIHCDAAFKDGQAMEVAKWPGATR